VRRAAPRRLDRFAATLVFATAASLVIGVTAFADSPPIHARDQVRPTVDDPYAYAQLLDRARRGDALSVEVVYEVVRRVGDDDRASTLTVARTPVGRVEWDDTGATLRVGAREWVCLTVDDEPQCPERLDDEPRSVGAATPWAGAAASGRYAFARRPDRTIAGRDAVCVRLELVGTEAVAGLGSRIDVCLDAAGVVLFTERTSATAVDRQVALTVRSIDDSDLAQRFAEASSGLVALPE
jgi:hypothetical protein